MLNSKRNTLFSFKASNFFEQNKHDNTRLKRDQFQVPKFYVSKYLLRQNKMNIGNFSSTKF